MSKHHVNQHDIGCGALLLMVLVAIAVSSRDCAVTKVQADQRPVVSYVVSLDGPVIEVPEAWADKAGQVAMCETGFRWPAPVGKAGERGSWQIHPIHFPRMTGLGLDTDSPVDLARYTVMLWERKGWQPWSCRP